MSPTIPLPIGGSILVSDGLSADTARSLDEYLCSLWLQPIYHSDDMAMCHLFLCFTGLYTLGFDALLFEIYSYERKRPEHKGNKGRHVVYFGSEYPSRVILPFVPLFQGSKTVDL
jgi:hypothetical protein